MRIVGLLLVLVFVAACGRPPEHRKSNPDLLAMSRADRLEEIESLEKKAMTTADTLDPVIAKELLQSYTAFSNSLRQDSLTPHFLFKAAEVAVNTGRHRVGIQYFSEIFEGYPTFTHNVEAGYMVPFIYDYYLNDRIMARKGYELIAELYPENKFGRDAAVRLTNLHLTDDQLIEMFKNRQAEGK